MIELAACPFIRCGGEAKIERQVVAVHRVLLGRGREGSGTRENLIDDGTVELFRVRCGKCGVCTQALTSEAAVIEFWNARI